MPPLAPPWLRACITPSIISIDDRLLTIMDIGLVITSGFWNLSTKIIIIGIKYDRQSVPISPLCRKTDGFPFCNWLQLNLIFFSAVECQMNTYSTSFDWSTHLPSDQALVWQWTSFRSFQLFQMSSEQFDLTFGFLQCSAAWSLHIFYMFTHTCCCDP